MQTSFYRFLKNGFILKNLETQPTLPNGLIFSQHKEKKLKTGGSWQKQQHSKFRPKPLPSYNLGLHRINSLPTWKSIFSSQTEFTQWDILNLNSVLTCCRLKILTTKRTGIRSFTFVSHEGVFTWEAFNLRSFRHAWQSLCTLVGVLSLHYQDQPLIFSPTLYPEGKRG